MVRIAINGFGRIGRMVFRRIMEEIANGDDSLEVVAINDLTDTRTLAHLLRYDSVHGKFPGKVEFDDNELLVNGHLIKVFAKKDPEELPWQEFNIDVVLECTGFFLTRELAQKHLTAGAKKVVLSAPAKSNDIKTIVKGVNEHIITEEDDIISNASCTTNCYAPIMKVLHDNVVIKKGFMMTAHAYTSTQRLVDAPHKDLRRARHAAVNMVPTTSGAAKAVGLVIPSLQGKLHASALRMPIPVGSMCYCVCEIEKQTSVDEVNELFASVAHHHLKGVVEYCMDPIVSSDIVGNTHSSVFDSDLTELDGNLLKVVVWYDNEWGYSSRMIDLAKLVALKLP